MDTLLVALPLLACPIMMGLMMWWMGRMGQDHGQPQGEDQEIAQLRAELDELRRSRES